MHNTKSPRLLHGGAVGLGVAMVYAEIHINLVYIRSLKEELMLLCSQSDKTIILTIAN